jgi:hypothetical protein
MEIRLYAVLHQMTDVRLVENQVDSTFRYSNITGERPSRYLVRLSKVGEAVRHHAREPVQDWGGEGRGRRQVDKGGSGEAAQARTAWGLEDAPQKKTPTEAGAEVSTGISC